MFPDCVLVFRANLLFTLIIYIVVSYAFCPLSRVLSSLLLLRCVLVCVSIFQWFMNPFELYLACVLTTTFQQSTHGTALDALCATRRSFLLAGLISERGRSEGRSFQNRERAVMWKIKPSYRSPAIRSTLAGISFMCNVERTLNLVASHISSRCLGLFCFFFLFLSRAQTWCASLIITNTYSFIWLSLY